MYQPPKQPGGNGSFDVTDYTSSTCGACNAGTRDESIAFDPDRWPWTGAQGKRFFKNTKSVSKGPRRGDGWAPVKPYTRGSLSSEPNGGRIANLGRAGRDWLMFGENLASRHTTQIAVFGPYMSIGGSITGTYKDQLRSQLVTECLAKVGDSKIRLGTAIAESKRTVDMIVSRGITVLRAYRYVRKLQFWKAAKELGTVWYRKKGRPANPAGVWLELQYGWKPLLADIHGGFQQLQSGFHKNKQIIHASRQLVISDDPRKFTPSGWKDCAGTVQLRGRCKLWYEIEDETLASMSALGLINPAEVAWELVPFSFIVDWFVPIGTFLQAMSAPAGMRFVDGALSWKADTLLTISGRLNAPAGYQVIQGDLAYHNVGFVFQREVVNNPQPRLYIAHNPLRGVRAVNLLALLTQARRGR